MPPDLLPDNTEPVFKPLHPAFKGTARVYNAVAHATKNLDGQSYEVNLTEGTCTCSRGNAFEWHNSQQRYTPYMYCSHKLRAIADIITEHDNDPEMVWSYTKAVAMRYNKYEVVSAFHKELRNGAVEQAVFWGSMLMTSRGLKGVYKYLLNILYEELRDHTLGAVFLERNIHQEQQS